MCGIAGIVGEADSIEHRLAMMLRAQGHRGRKDRGFWVSSFVDARLGMAHNAAVVSETAEHVKQPYVDEETSLVVAVDGDIYNYRELRRILSCYYTFLTDSPVEVVAKAYHRWGEGALLRFEGAFVMAVYDRTSDMLLLARDRFGVKPLYYATQRGNLFFASEVRTLFAAGLRRQISAERWAGYMLYSSYGLPYETFWEDIHQLPAGFLLQYNGYSLCERAWYSLQEEVDALSDSRDAERLSNLFLDELERCTDRSLADVSSCGFRVAGRIESQLLHSLAAHGSHVGKIHTFAGVGNYRERTGEEWETEPVYLTTEQAISELERMTRWVEEPFDGPESLMRTAIFRQAGHYGTRVLYSGVGLDLLWQDEWDYHDLRYNYLEAHHLFSREFSHLAVHPHYPHPFDNESDNIRYLDLACERLPHILRFFDKASVSAGVQVRMPFLHSTLVALSFALPAVSKRCRKELFDSCMENRYTTKFCKREDYSPMPLWMSNGMKEWMSDALADLRRSAVRDWFNAGALERLWQEFGEGVPTDMALLWKCLSLRQQLYDEE